MIYFKSPHLQNEYNKIPPVLTKIVFVTDFLAQQLFGENGITITSIYRPKTTDSGIHSEYRAVDLAIFEKSGQEGTYRMARFINSIWTYDYTRPNMQVANTTLYHGTAPHLHLQTHSNTSSQDPVSQKVIASILEVQKKGFVPLKGIA